MIENYMLIKIKTSFFHAWAAGRKKKKKSYRNIAGKWFQSPSSFQVLLCLDRNRDHHRQLQYTMTIFIQSQSQFADNC
jgi:hypothetical protein